MSPDEAIAAVKQAANALYALGWSDSPIGPEDRQKLRRLSERLDEVTKAFGGNPMTPAWGICCGTDGTHECARQWTCGGETGPLGSAEKVTGPE